MPCFTWQNILLEFLLEEKCHIPFSIEISLLDGFGLHLCHPRDEVEGIVIPQGTVLHGSVRGISSVQSLSHVQLFATPWITARQASLSITNSQSLLKPTFIESMMPSSHLILCCPLLLLPSIPPSIRVFSNESTLHIRWPKYWSFSFSIIPSKEIPGLISFRMDWLDLLAVQGTLKSLLQHHGSKASILLRSAFFTVQLSHSYMTTGKTIALTRQTFVGKVMSLFSICYLGLHRNKTKSCEPPNGLNL